MTLDEWAAQKWAQNFTPAADGSYTMSAWLPGLPIYDDRFQLAAMQCLIDGLQMPQGIRASINSPGIVGTTQAADWQFGGATLRVQWGWSTDESVTLTFWQD